MVMHEASWNSGGNQKNTFASTDKWETFAHTGNLRVGLPLNVRR
jgi:hypothetical protein